MRNLPDKLYLKLLYWSYTGHILNLKNPQRFTEKIQWLKLYDRNPIYTKMVDKYEVKQLVSNKIGSKYIIPTLGIYESWDQINFDELPDGFVIKTTHGGGSNGVVVVTDKSKFNVGIAKTKIENSLKDDGFSAYRGYQYKDVEKRILIEKLIKSDDGLELSDYKFFCFNGIPKFCQVIRNRSVKESIDFYDMEWRHQDFIGLNPNVDNGTTPVPKPVNFDSMKRIAEVLSQGIPFLRVDLYNINGKIYFGETTFHPATGLGFFKPDIYDFILGEMLQLPSE